MCPEFKISEQFFYDVWIELDELHKKKYVSNLKKIFYESRNSGSIPLRFENNGILDFSREIFFLI
jgi:hypothetical protein